MSLAGPSGPGQPARAAAQRPGRLVALAVSLTSLAGIAGIAVPAPAGADPLAPLPRPQASAAVGLEVFARGLSHPWGLAALPDGSWLVTEREGRMRRIGADGQLSEPIRGLPPVVARNQGGLLDVAVDPSFSDAQPWVYWTYAEPGAGDEDGLAGTALARGRLQGLALHDVQVLFRQLPKVRGSGHFGARIVFDRDREHLFVTLGERQLDRGGRGPRAWAQDPAVGMGKVVRLRRDGRPAGAEPPVPGGLAGLWSLGHRNPQGAALHPVSGALWVAEHGPQGGDEINVAHAGHNFGWPWVSYGCPYGAAEGTACRFGGGRHAPAFREPVSTWVPVSIAPSGMAFYTGSRYPAWKGDLFVGALRGQALWRLVLDGERVVAREALFEDAHERIRDVRQGPDSRLYLLTDSADGTVLRTRP